MAVAAVVAVLSAMTVWPEFEVDIHISSKCDIFKINKWILRQSIKNPAENFGKITQFKFQILGKRSKFFGKHVQI